MTECQNASGSACDGSSQQEWGEKRGKEHVLDLWEEGKKRGMWNSCFSLPNNREYGYLFPGSCDQKMAPAKAL